MSTPAFPDNCRECRHYSGGLHWPEGVMAHKCNFRGRDMVRVIRLAMRREMPLLTPEWCPLRQEVMEW